MKARHLHKIEARASRVRSVIPSPERYRRFMLSQGLHKGDVNSALFDVERFFDTDLPELLECARKCRCQRSAEARHDQTNA